MRMLRGLAAATAVLALSCSSVFAQQRHAVDPASLADAVRQHAIARNADRAVVQQTLARPDVRRAADRARIDLNRVSAAVNTLSVADLQRAAAASRDVATTLDGDSLAGGASTVTISTTTIIIGLLVLILLIVALD